MILVTGASGFVGSKLITFLAQTGKKVRAATRHPSLIVPNPLIEAISVPDYTQRIEWAALLDGVTKVVHLAGLAHAEAGIHAPDTYQRINSHATAEMVGEARRAHVERFILISSIGAQSGPSADHVLTEDDDPKPVDPYGQSKLNAEAVVRQSDIPYVVLRPAVVYGPGAKGNPARLMRVVNTPWPLPFAAFDNRRSLLSVDNLVEAILLVLETSRALGNIYVVADYEALTLAEIIRTLRIAANRPTRLFPVSPRLIEIALRRMGRDDLWQRIGGTLLVDSSKLLSIGWKPPIETSVGLAEMAKSYLPTRP